MIAPNSAERKPAPASGPRFVWVPGSYDDAPAPWVHLRLDTPLILMCALTGERFVVRTGLTDLLAVPVGGGRVRMEPAVRAEYVRHSKGLVLARLKDGRELWVKIVAGWQFADGTPPAAVFTRSKRDPLPDAA